MSAPTTPVATDAPSLSAVRGLMERNLVERAVALSESRWPGSGTLVQLAHEWGRLSPAARREQLASIGPEELARLRGLGQLNPDLERVLADLETRGIIPPPAQPPATPADVPPATFEERLANAATDYAEQAAAALAERASDTIRATEAPPVPDAEPVPPPEASASPLRRVEMPALDLGLPSTSAFLDDEARRREATMRAASDMLERVRSRLERQAERVTTGEPTVPRDTPPPAAAIVGTSQAEEQPTADPTEADATIRAASATDTAIASADRLGEQLERERVVQVDPDCAAAGDTALRRLATELQLGYVELSPFDLGGRAFYGGLARSGRSIVTQAGAFPQAVNEPNLVVVRGLLYPRTIDRLRAGFCDIPGTQATVRVHPRCRIVVTNG
jgi:hypothetical protein